MAALLLVPWLSLSARADGPFTLLHSFAGQDSTTDLYPEGESPSSIILGSDGNLHGVTYAGGDSNHGVFYSMSTDGTITPEYSFTGGADGSSPKGPLLETDPGVFFGVTLAGGTDQTGADPTPRRGTIYQKSPGAFTTIFAFSDPYYTNGMNEEGASPNPLLLRGPDAHDGRKVLYGTTSAGGQYGQGTIFRVVTDGTVAGTQLTTLYNFDSSSFVFGYLVMGSDGALYGLSDNFAYDQGTFFKVTTDGTAAGTVVTTLYSFTPTDNLSTPLSLAQAPNGPGGRLTFMGVSLLGGDSAAGAIFKIATDGTPTHTTVQTLHAFALDNTGYEPECTLTTDAAGNFYGVTDYTNQQGAGNGTLFRITTGGAFTLLHTFAAGEAQYPASTLVYDPKDGNLYGVSEEGGANGTGTAFDYPLSGGSSASAGQLAISETIATTSDPVAGTVARTGDTVIHRYDFSVSGGDASSLQVAALIPFYVHSDIQLAVAAVRNSNILRVTSGTTALVKVGGTVSGGSGLLPGSPTVTAVIDATHLRVKQGPTGREAGGGIGCQTWTRSHIGRVEGIMICFQVVGFVALFEQFGYLVPGRSVRAGRRLRGAHHCLAGHGNGQLLVSILHGEEDRGVAKVVNRAAQDGRHRRDLEVRPEAGLAIGAARGQAQDIVTQRHGFAVMVGRTVSDAVGHGCIGGSR